ncbi:MAG: hypothetical protein HOD64_11980 [Candidatus Cloacimonetes bacterium]|nr:hypothetical protein [Candidatus Cloacimonadota bacterium]MBT4333980.1 hypothetical protein [Candidatus Cloacimonadota bacterium]
METLNQLIHEVTISAYENAGDWMRSDVSISSQLRDGIKTARESFAKIDDQIEDIETLLDLMQQQLENVLIFYRQLPGDQGQWECSALNIISRDIKKLLNDHNKDIDISN